LYYYKNAFYPVLENGAPRPASPVMQQKFLFAVRNSCSQRSPANGRILLVNHLRQIEAEQAGKSLPA